MINFFSFTYERNNKRTTKKFIHKELAMEIACQMMMVFQVHRCDGNLGVHDELTFKKYKNAHPYTSNRIVCVCVCVCKCEFVHAVCLQFHCERQWHSSQEERLWLLFSPLICKTFNIRIVCVIQNNWSFFRKVKIF